MRASLEVFPRDSSAAAAVDGADGGQHLGAPTAGG